MNRYMLTLATYINLALISMTFFAAETNPVDLSILNDSDSTVLIMFTRTLGAAPRAKLLEAGEAIDFGRVYEASVQSYSTLWGYIAPAKHVVFSAYMIRSTCTIEDIAIRIKGIYGRSLFQPFGQWEYEFLPGKKAIDLIPQGAPRFSRCNGSRCLSNCKTQNYVHPSLYSWSPTICGF